MSQTIDTSSLSNRLAAAFSCESKASNQERLALIGELLAYWNSNGVPEGGAPISGVQTPSLLVATGNGNVAAGAKSIAFSSNGSFVGTLLGVPFPANTSIGFQAQDGHTLDAFAYTVSAGSLTIAKVV